MRLLIFVAICAYAYGHDVQSVKSVKGGHSSFQYQGGDLTRFYNNNTYSGGYNSTHGSDYRPAQVPAVNFEVGVCYVEVPTASLVRDKVKVPAGNGSRPELSRIRTCCKGYARNVYNFRICEPVCTQECENGLCTAPDTCTCFPDHVRNQVGQCVATCPIGCQNGRCDGGECMCKEGFTLNISGKFCIPSCRHNCGGQGICTAPNTCTCNPGYKTTLDGACQVDCGKCDNGDCLSSTECRCRPGFTKDRSGQCTPQCNQDCGPNKRCVAPNICGSSSLPGHGTVNQTNIPHQLPQHPGQNNTFYYNPNQGSSYPLPPYNQNGPQTPNQGPQPYPSYPNQGSGYPHPSPNQSNPGQPQHGSYYPYQPNPNQPQGSNFPPPIPNQPQGSNYPPTNPNQQHPQPTPIFYNQGSNNPQYPYGQHPQNPSIYPDDPNYIMNFNPNQPNPSSYPAFSQVKPNETDSSRYPYGPNPQNPSKPHQGSYNPNVEDISGSTPYPGYYPGTQVRPNSTGFNNSPGQHYPDNQRPSYYPSYQSRGQNGYDTQYNVNSYDQQSIDQTHESETELCSVPCINGQCIDRNRCRCNPGYITDEMDPFGARCRPHCPGGCPNGYCAAPHSCACDEGYYKDSSVKGRSVCIKRIRRSIQELVFNIPDYADE